MVARLLLVEDKELYAQRINTEHLHNGVEFLKGRVSETTFNPGVVVNVHFGGNSDFVLRHSGLLTSSPDLFAKLFADFPLVVCGHMAE